MNYKQTIFSTMIIIVLLAIFSIDTNAQTTQDYIKKYEKMIAKEKATYERACSLETVEAYREYLKEYPKGIFIGDIKDRISEFNVWERTKYANTIEAYDIYLKNSKLRSYGARAKESIAKLQMIAAWNSIKNSVKIDNFVSFKSKYPLSPYCVEAQDKIHELTAIKYYDSKNYNSAYSEFNKIIGEKTLSESYEYYKICEERYMYSSLSSYSNESDIRNFISRFPNSEYNNEVSNMLAINLSNKFTLYSTQETYDTALSFAKDKDIMLIVQMNIKSIENSKKEYNKNKRKEYKIKYGGVTNWGAEICDMGFSTTGGDVLYYNIGLSMKLGNYKSPVQFEIGLKPGYLMENNSNDNKFHLPLYAKLKFNVCNSGPKSKLYINATGYYNAVKSSYLEDNYSIGIGVGFAWRHWDWSIYNKGDIGSINVLNFIGTSLVYYF